MEVIKYLKLNSLDDLTSEFGIKSKVYGNGLVVLNYDQINSPKFHPIVRECRGLIIDFYTMSPVSRTFDRFFNLNEKPNDDFDPNLLVRVEEKADGSLMSVYWHDDRWNVATRGNAYAEGETLAGITFEGVFLDTIGMCLDDFMRGMNKNRSYTFELCSIYNKVVKFYEKPVIYLLNVFDFVTNKELDSYNIDNIAKFLNVKRPIVYDIEMDDVVKSFEEFPATEEGYVLIDANGNRVKVKNPAYVNLHHLKGNGTITPKRITDVVFNGETEEVLEYFPEYSDIFYPYQYAYDDLVHAIKKDWELLQKMDLDQKQFALSINHLFYKGILFSLRKGLTLDEAFGKLGKSSKVGLLEPIVKFIKEKK